jgi:dTDP-4-amino-4,6-dideoxygalactose transaminase
VDTLLSFAESPLHHAKPPLGRVAAILVVHQIGIPCDLDAISAIARQHGLPLVEDAACAIGSRYRGTRIGAPRGDIACFSFHPRKVITTGDGGMLTTARADLDQRVRLLRQHGMQPPPAGSFFEGYAATAYNYRLTDVQAAIGSEQLKKLDEIVCQRRERVDCYRRELGDHPAFRIPKEAETVFSNWQSLPLEFDSAAIDQVALLTHLQASGVASKPGIMNAHEEAPYRGLWRLPESERKRRSTIFIPLFHDLGDEAIRQVVDALKSFLARP